MKFISFFFCLIFLLLARLGFSQSTKCDCYKKDNATMKTIYHLIDTYKGTCDRYFMNGLPPYRDKWELKYHQKFKTLISGYVYNAYRYPDVFKNILIDDQIINLCQDFWWDSWHELYMRPGWNYSLAEKKAMIAKERNKSIENAKICKQKIDESMSELTNQYALLFEYCLKNHSNLNSLHDYGMFAYRNNNFEKSLEVLSLMVDKAVELGQLENLNTEFYHSLGSVCIEVMAYDKAVKYLTESITKDPSNKAAYFDRALAYFETGNFDQAINDYLASDKGKSTPSSVKEASDSFTEALLNSTLKGMADAAVEFVPSLCSSAYGLGETLWITAQHPVESAKNFANAAYAIGECAVNYCKGLDRNQIEGCIEQIKVLYDNYDQLNDSQKGELIGYAIGKYGVDIFAMGGFFKGLNAMKNLRNVNRICNLDAMVISNANKEVLVSSALKHAAERENYFKNISIHWDRQNKHIPGKHNFDVSKGTISIEPQKLEILVKKHVGKGQKVSGEFGEAGFVERVDFGTIIGKYATGPNVSPAQFLPTTKGIIKYAKDGKVHVIPSDPSAIIK